MEMHGMIAIPTGAKHITICRVPVLPVTSLQRNSFICPPYEKVPVPMDQIALKTPNPKCWLFLKIDMQRYLVPCVYLSEAPSPPRFCLGW